MTAMCTRRELQMSPSTGWRPRCHVGSLSDQDYGAEELECPAGPPPERCRTALGRTALAADASLAELATSRLRDATTRVPSEENRHSSWDRSRCTTGRTSLASASPSGHVCSWYGSRPVQRRLSRAVLPNRITPSQGRANAVPVATASITRASTVAAVAPAPYTTTHLLLREM